MGHATASTSRFRRELTLDGIYEGRWNSDELELGSEVTDVIDPEYGPGTAGGRQTGGDIALNRPWRYGRERPTYQRLNPKRGRSTGTLSVWELDEYGVPTSSEPFATYTVALVSVTCPEGDAEGDDKAVITIGLRVNP